MDDSSSSCRRNVHRVLNRLTLLPAGAEALLTLVPKLMLKLREEEDEEEEEEEVQVLLLSTLSSCSRLDALPALASDGVSLLGHRLSHRSSNIRREAAAVIMALRCVRSRYFLSWSTCCMTKTSRFRPTLQESSYEEEEEKERKSRKSRKALVMYSLRALTALAEAPDGRRLLLEQLPLLLRRSEAAEEDQDIRRDAQTAVR
ncbi:hypothetical protein FQN60_018333, partial [Etheostoma spectabile]